MRKPCVGYENTKEMRWDKSKGQEKKKMKWEEYEIVNIEKNKVWEGCDMRWG